MSTAENDITERLKYKIVAKNVGLDNLPGVREKNICNFFVDANTATELKDSPNVSTVKFFEKNELATVPDVGFIMYEIPMRIATGDNAKLLNDNAEKLGFNQEIQHSDAVEILNFCVNDDKEELAKKILLYAIEKAEKEYIVVGQVLQVANQATKDFFEKLFPGKFIENGSTRFYVARSADVATLLGNPNFVPKKSASQPAATAANAATDANVAPQENAAPTATTAQDVVAPPQEQPVAAPEEKPVVVEEKPAPAAAPEEKPVVADDIAKQAIATLAATEAIVQPADQSEPKCDAVKDAAAKALSQTESLIKSMEDYDKQVKTLSDILLRKDKLIDELLILKTQATALQGTNQKIELELVSCRSEKKALEEKIKILEDEINKLQIRIANFEREQGVSGALAEKILQQIVIYEEKIDELFSLKEKINSQLAQFGSTDVEQFAKLEKLGNSLEKRYEEIELRIKEFRAKEKQVTDQSEDIAKQCDEERKKLADCLQQAQLFKEQLDKKTTDEERLQIELAKCGDRTKQLSKAFNDFCKSQSAAFERLNGQLEQVSQKVTNSIASLSSIVAAQLTQVGEQEQKVQVVEAQALAQPSQ